MRAVRCLAYGPPEDLVVVEVTDPEPGPGEALVDVRAAAANYPDVLMVANEFRTFAQHAPELAARDRAELLELFFEGRVHPHISRVVGLDDAGTALHALADRTATGKLLVDPGR